MEGRADAAIAYPEQVTDFSGGFLEAFIAAWRIRLGLASG